MHIQVVNHLKTSKPRLCCFLLVNMALGLTIVGRLPLKQKFSLPSSLLEELELKNRMFFRPFDMSRAFDNMKPAFLVDRLLFYQFERLLIFILI